MSPLVRTVLAAAIAAAAPAQAPVVATLRSPTPVLPAGTPVRLVTIGEINSKTHLQGARFDLAVAEDVRIGNVVAIPKDAPALGEVARHVARGGLAKSGKLELRLLHVEVGGRRIRLDGSAAQKGPGATGSPVATGVVIIAIGAILQGKNASIPAGTPITGYVHRDIPLTVAGGR